MVYSNEAFKKTIFIYKFKLPTRLKKTLMEDILTRAQTSVHNQHRVAGRILEPLILPLVCVLDLLALHNPLSSNKIIRWIKWYNIPSIVLNPQNVKFCHLG